jgi:hypothetical protein
MPQASEPELRAATQNFDDYTGVASVESTGVISFTKLLGQEDGDSWERNLVLRDVTGAA